MPAYKSGDLAYINDHGKIVFMGRMDNQVKLRGLRVELDEIENVINTFKGINHSVVLVKENEKSGQYLCAYYTANNEISKDKLIEHMKKSLTHYMIPNILIQLDKFQLNNNGKIDKKSLPEPDFSLLSSNIIKPKNNMQTDIYAIVAKIMGNESFGIDTDLFSVGLTSITAIKLNVQLAKKFNIELKTSAIIQNNTIEKLEKLILTSVKKEEYTIRKSYPICENQKGIFALCMANEGTTMYNIPLLYKLSSKVDTNKLKIAIDKTIDAHPYLKAKLKIDEDGNIIALRNDAKKPSVKIVECDALPKNNLVKPFDLLKDTLYRACIYKCKDNNYLFLDFHHIIFDGTSTNIFLDDINSAYIGDEIKFESYTGFEAALDEEKVVNHHY